MSWSIETIEKDLLLSKIGVLAMAPEAVVSAVNRVERVLGSEWIGSISGKGIAPAMEAIGMGLRLASIENLGGAEDLITHIRRKDQDAESELTAIHVIRSQNSSAQLELHPAVGTRKADFRARRVEGEQWTTVEVTKPNTSEEQQRIEGVLRRIEKVFEKVEYPFSLDIVFRREPSASEIELLCERLPQFCQLLGQQRAELVDGMGFLFLNHVEIGKLQLVEIPELAETPTIGIATFFGGGSDGRAHHQVSVRIPFSDERAEEILRDEARQLPKPGVGMVMIDVPASPKELRGWVSLIERRFQPAIHTRISGVCLFSGGMVPVGDRYGWLLQTKLLTNPHAQFQLPSWIQAAIKSAGEEFDHAASQWKR
jgi:hypothetical protein